MRNCFAGGLTLLLFLPAFGSNAPDWVLDLGRSKHYPSSHYFTGFGASIVSQKDHAMLQGSIEQASQAARVQMLESMRIEVSSHKKSRVTVSNRTRSAYIEDLYGESVGVAGYAELAGTKTILYHDRRAKTVYAFIYVKKNSLGAIQRIRYRQNIAALRQMKSYIDTLQSDAISAEMHGAISECAALLKRVSENMQTMSICGIDHDPDDRDIEIMSDLRILVGRHRQNRAADIEGLAILITHKLNQALDSRNGLAIVFATSLNDTYRYSPFSAAFRSALEQRIERRARMKPLHTDMRGFLFASSFHAQKKIAIEKGAAYIISGSYALHHDSVICSVTLRETHSSEILSTAAATLGIAHDDAVFFRPAASPTFIGDTTATDSTIISGNLSLRVWTNFGESNLHLTEGADLAIFVMVNKPCYLRLISRLPDGTPVIPELHYQNYYLPENMVNRIVELPDTFSVSSPTGTESLEIAVSTSPFPAVKLQSRTYDGSEYLVISGMQPLFRLLKSKFPGSEFAHCELIINTVPAASDLTR